MITVWSAEPPSQRTRPLHGAGSHLDLAAAAPGPGRTPPARPGTAGYGAMTDGRILRRPVLSGGHNGTTGSATQKNGTGQPGGRPGSVRAGNLAASARRRPEGRGLRSCPGPAPLTGAREIALTGAREIAPLGARETAAGAVAGRRRPRRRTAIPGDDSAARHPGEATTATVYRPMRLKGVDWLRTLVKRARTSKVNLRQNGRNHDLDWIVITSFSGVPAGLPHLINCPTNATGNRELVNTLAITGRRG